MTPGLRAAQLGLMAMIVGLGLVVMYAAAGMAAVALYQGAAETARAADAAIPVVRGRPRHDPRTPDRLARLRDDAAAEAAARRSALLGPHRLVVEQLDRAAENRRRPAEPDPDGPPGTAPGWVREAVAEADRRSPPWRSTAFPVWAGVLLVPAAWVVGAMAFRGGLSMRLAGVAVVRADGRRAGRRQSAARAALVWLPVTLLLAGSVWVQVAYFRHPYVAAGLWLLAVALLPVYVVIALRDPARPPQDRLVGTHLVPE